MTALVQDVTQLARPELLTPTGVAARPPVDDLPDATRDFFAGCVTTFDLPPYEAMVGPLTATPGRTLADVVKAIAG